MSKPKRKVFCKELNVVFNSIQEAALELDLHEKCIWRCCNNKQKQAYGFKWKFI